VILKQFLMWLTNLLKKGCFDDVQNDLMMLRWRVEKKQG